MNKVLGLPLLLLANFIILAHAVVPHHHHHSGIVVSICHFLSIHETLEHLHNHYHTTVFHNNHESDNSNQDGGIAENCVLNDLYYRIIPVKQHHFSYIDSDSFIPLYFNLLCSPAPDNEIEIRDYGNLPFRQKPYIASTYLHFANHSLGLRAPPAC